MITLSISDTTEFPPNTIGRYIVEAEGNSTQDLSVGHLEWDNRIISLFHDNKLVILLDIFENGEYAHFRGFLIYDLNDPTTTANSTTISESFRVEYVVKTTNNIGIIACNFCRRWNMDPRSFVYDRNFLMTIRENVVVSTNLDTRKDAWRINVTLEGEDNPEQLCCA